ncbi:MAG TPA: trypsin-like serine protease [Polyangiaceae bacterium]|nr:trypsin-like serine protease [Polyangiaceae bacterium]
MDHRLSFLGRSRPGHSRPGCCALALAALSACGSPDAGLALGHSEQAILRGQVDREHPQVLLLANQAGFLCTGTLIQVRQQTGFLLTAAHCVTEEDPGATRLPPEQFVVLAGTDFRDSTDVFAVDEIRVHPGYDGSFAQNDIAVVRLDLGDSPPPTAIPPLSAEEDALAVNDRLLLVGYGQTEGDGENSLRRHVSREILDLDPQLVAYTQEDGKGTCFGDSGGPGLVSVRGQERVASVTSGGVDADERCEGGFGVGMRVSAFSAFIEGALSGDN